VVERIIRMPLRTPRRKAILPFLQAADALGTLEGWVLFRSSSATGGVASRKLAAGRFRTSVRNERAFFLPSFS
jgi:hypothetical protein